MHDERYESGKLISAPSLLTTVLYMVAVALMLLALVASAMLVARGSEAGIEQDPIPAGLVVLVWFLASGSIAALLWAMAWLVRRHYVDSICQERILSALQHIKAGQAAADGAPSPALPEQSPARGELLEEVRDELREMNANLLMSPEQREAKGRRRQENVAKHIQSDFDQSIATHDFARSQRLVELFERELPDDKRCGELNGRLTEARAEAEAEDLRLETKRVDDLMAVSAFDEAAEAARALADRYPGSPSCEAIVHRVQREADAFSSEHRKRLYADLEKYAAARRWAMALSSAQRLVRSHASSSEADAAEAMMPTLEENARIEEVRRLRDDFGDMIKRKRYTQALYLAQEITSRFPDTQAAKELIDQMDRLRELTDMEGKAQ